MPAAAVQEGSKHHAQTQLVATRNLGNISLEFISLVSARAQSRMGLAAILLQTDRRVAHITTVATRPRGQGRHAYQRHFSIHSPVGTFANHRVGPLVIAMAVSIRVTLSARARRHTIKQ